MLPAVMRVEVVASFTGLVLTLLLAPALAVGLGALVAAIATGDRIRLHPPERHLALSADALTALVSIVLAALAFAVLPWPLHPAGAGDWVGHPSLVWVMVEGAFLVPLLTGLLAPSPLAMRAALRDAQISAAGRIVVWLVIGGSLWSGAGWEAYELPGRGLLLVAGLMAIAAVAGIGPFAPDDTLAPAGAEEGADAVARWLASLARHVRGGLAVALLVAGVIPGPAVVQPVPALLLALGLFVVVTLGLRQVRLALPRFTLHMALRWCLWRALPVGLAGVLYLALT